jgi:hypothetical protein
MAALLRVFMITLLSIFVKIEISDMSQAKPVKQLRNGCYTKGVAAVPGKRNAVKEINK